MLIQNEHFKRRYFPTVYRYIYYQSVREHIFINFAEEYGIVAIIFSGYLRIGIFTLSISINF